MHARIANRNRFIRSESADKQHKAKALKLLLEQTQNHANAPAMVWRLCSPSLPAYELRFVSC